MHDHRWTTQPSAIIAYQLKRCYPVSQYHSRPSATAQTCIISTLLLGNLLMESVPPWDLYIAAQHLVFTVTICNSHEPLATPSIIARVSIFQAWVVVQWCCRFNDSHRWDFPPPISTNLVVGCSVRGRSHFCCGSSSTVSSFPSQLLNQTRNFDLGSIPPVSPVSAPSAIKLVSPFASSACNPCSSMPLCT